MSHEAIYRRVYAQPVATLRLELIALRTSSICGSGPQPAPAPRIRESRCLDERPDEAEGRAVPGHWEGDIVVGKGGRTAVAAVAAVATVATMATVVERTSRFLVLSR